MLDAHKNRVNRDLINENYLKLSMEQLRLKHIYSVEDITKNIFIPDIQNVYEDLVTEFLNGEYEEDIYKCSSLTNQIRTLKAFAMSESIDYTILCENKVQEKFINNIKETVGHTIVDSRSNVDIKPYGRIVVGYVQDLADFKEPIMKNFLVANFRENFEPTAEHTLLGNYIIPLMDVNKFQIFEAYLLNKPKG